MFRLLQGILVIVLLLAGVYIGVVFHLTAVNFILSMLAGFLQGNLAERASKADETGV